MEEGRWPKVVFNDRLCKRKKTWMQQITNGLVNGVFA